MCVALAVRGRSLHLFDGVCLIMHVDMITSNRTDVLFRVFCIKQFMRPELEESESCGAPNWACRISDWLYA